MHRKIVQQGLGGCTVSLPIKWIRENKLSPGQDVDILQEKNNLIITGSGKEYLRKKEVRLGDECTLPQIRTIIASEYKAGCDEIHLSLQKVPQIQKINEIINSFTGLELVSQKNNCLVIKSFLKADEKEVENLIIKMFQSINTLIKYVLTDWNKTDINTLNNQVEFNIRKIRDHTLRVIHVTKYGGEKSYDYYDLVTQLEKIAVKTYYLADNIICLSINKTKNSSLLDFQKEFESAYRCFLKKDFVKSNKMWQDTRNKMNKLFSPKGFQKFTKSHCPTIIIYYGLMMNLRQIQSRILSLST